MKFDGVAVVPTSPARVDRLMRSAIESMSLDLTGIVVLTEAASAHFDVTCLMAGLADADAVIAIVRDSRWGSANDVVAAVRSRAGQLGIEGRIEFAPKVTRSVAAGCSLVNNLAVYNI